MATSNFSSDLKHSDMFSHVSSFGYLPRWGVLLMDLFLCLVAFWTSVLIGNGIYDYEDFSKDINLWIQCGTTLGIQCICFWLFHTYSGILRY